MRPWTADYDAVSTFVEVGQRLGDVNDTTFINDSSPSWGWASDFMMTRFVQCFVDYDDPDQREQPGGPTPGGGLLDDLGNLSCRRFVDEPIERELRRITLFLSLT